MSGGVLAVVASNPRRRRKLSRRVLAIEYEHADDGEKYRHDFGRGVDMDVEPDGSVRVKARGGRRTARKVGGQTFLVNPPNERYRGYWIMSSPFRPDVWVEKDGYHISTHQTVGAAKRTIDTLTANPTKGAKVAKRKPPGRYKTWSAWAAGMKRARARKGGKRTTAARRKRTTVTRKKRRNPAPAKRRARGATTVKRRRRTPVRRRATARRSPARRRYRRNPPMMKRITDSSIAVIQMLAGKFLARVVPQYIPGMPRNGAIGLLAQLAVAIGLGMVASRVVGARAAENIVRGALLAPLEGAIIQAGIPIVSPALAGNGLGSYVQARRGRGSVTRPGLSAYVQSAEADPQGALYSMM